MAAKAKIHAGILGDQLAARLSREARALLPTAQLAGQSVDAIVFEFNSSAVVTGRALRRALDRLDKLSRARLVIIGWDFTLEARAIVQEMDAVLVFAREFGWSDARWLAARQG